MEPAGARLWHTPLAEHQAATVASEQRAPRPHPPEPAEPKPVPAAGESARQKHLLPSPGRKARSGSSEVYRRRAGLRMPRVSARANGVLAHLSTTPWISLSCNLLDGLGPCG